MISQIALMPILGYPAIMYGGILTFILFLFIAIIGWRTVHGKCKFKNPLKVHQILAIIALILGLIHGFLGLSILIGF
jgi:succinate dehydrogenase hydrophobic anchor subunit